MSAEPAGSHPREAKRIIEKLSLAPHPEGGWYRELWRADAPAGERGAATSIHFLLESHQRSHWHKVDAAEIWFWHSGDPLMVSVAADDAGPVRDIRLGPNVLGADLPQYLIEPNAWQAAAPLPGPFGYTLVSCVVFPAFEFAGFELAPAAWRPGATEPGPRAAD